MARTTLVLGMVCAALLLVAVDARGEELYDYETCFAFDPVFVQADQRHVPSAAKPQVVQAPERATDEAKPAPAPRIVLRAVAKALQALETAARKSVNTTLGRRGS